MYVLIANMLDTTVKTQEDIEKAIKIPVLANIPIYNMEMENLRKKEVEDNEKRTNSTKRSEISSF